MSETFSNPLVISLEEFEKAISKGWFNPKGEIVIQPVLQMWGQQSDGRYRATGYMAVSGLQKNVIIVSAYSSDNLEPLNAQYDAGKFNELIELTIGDFLNFILLDACIEGI